MLHACNAVDGTTKKRYPQQGVATRFRCTIRDSLDIFRVMAAPGIDILTTVPQTGYDFVSGSSLAAAHVTGVVALLLEEDPNLGPAQALDLLRATSRPLAVAAASTPRRAGLVDACAALGKLTGRSSCL